jgi:hypothetical protein
VGENYLVEEDIGADLGGSATNFARALLNTGEWRPLIVGAAPQGPLGNVLESEALHLAPASMIDRPNGGDADPVIVTLWDEAGTRLMVRPKSTANDQLSESFVKRQLHGLAQRKIAVAGCFISGYSLTQAESPRYRSLSAISAWCAARRVPVVVDLVPHNFLESVGPLDHVIELFGRDVSIVAELHTGLELLNWSESPDVDSTLRRATIELSKRSGAAVIQHRQSDTRYLQAIARGSEFDLAVHHLDGGPAPRGFGDQMLASVLGSLFSGSSTIE